MSRIVTAYNDMLSAHQPLATYPDEIKAALREIGAVGQVAGGVPAMCDGVTQGEIGHGAVAVLARCHRDVDGGRAEPQHVRRGPVLGVCDKIVPGMLIGALRFGHLPVIFVPAGPMTSGMSNA
jgi:phosphogluconate dehydratase